MSKSSIADYNLGFNHGFDLGFNFTQQSVYAISSTNDDCWNCGCDQGREIDNNGTCGYCQKTFYANPNATL